MTKPNLVAKITLHLEERIKTLEESLKYERKTSCDRLNRIIELEERIDELGSEIATLDSGDRGMV